jgi:hypothetical protein
MKTKRLLCPERLRQVPRQFSWIDQRLVREGHIARCNPQALALYLFLVTVADAEGLSYYSDAKAARLLSLSGSELREARGYLLRAKRPSRSGRSASLTLRVVRRRDERASSIRSNPPSSAGCNDIPIQRRKSSSVCVLRGLILAASLSSQTIYA